MKLKDVTTIISGGTPSTKKGEYWNGSISWITPKDLSGYNKMYISKGERNITDSGLKNSSAYLIPKGSVLFSSRAPIGYVAIADNELCTNQGFKNFICDKSKINNIYLYYWLKNNVKTIEEFASGSTFKEISASKISNIEIELPSLTMQKKISSILSSLDKKIELNNQINDNLYEMMNKLYINWFEDFKVYNKNEFSNIKLRDIINIKGGLSYTAEKLSDNKNDNVMISMGNVELNKLFNFNNLKYYKDIENKYLAKPGDLFICTRDVTQKRNQLGCPGIIPKLFENKNIMIGTNLFMVEHLIYDKEINKYLFLLLNSKKYRERIVGLAKGTAILMISRDDVLNFEFYFPNEIDIINKFNKIVEPLFNKIESNIIINDHLYKLRDTLLPKLMNGEIDLESIEV